MLGLSMIKCSEIFFHKSMDLFQNKYDFSPFLKVYNNIFNDYSILIFVLWFHLLLVITSLSFSFSLSHCLSFFISLSLFSIFLFLSITYISLPILYIYHRFLSFKVLKFGAGLVLSCTVKLTVILNWGFQMECRWMLCTH